MTFKDLPLRAQKNARTRVALLDALISHLADQPLAEIAVSVLAADAQISVATFFNYFPTKSDLLTYFVQVWSLNMGALAQRIKEDHASPLAAIEAIFAETAKSVMEHPNVMLEIIAHQAHMPANLELEPIDNAVRLLRLPEVDDVNALPDLGFGAVIPPLLQSAIEAKELPANTIVELLLLSLGNVFFGVPLLLGRSQPLNIGLMYQAQLELLWAGIWAQS